MGGEKAGGEETGDGEGQGKGWMDSMRMRERTEEDKRRKKEGGQKEKEQGGEGKISPPSAISKVDAYADRYTLNIYTLGTGRKNHAHACTLFYCTL